MPGVAPFAPQTISQGELVEPMQPSVALGPVPAMMGLLPAWIAAQRAAGRSPQQILHDLQSQPPPP